MLKLFSKTGAKKPEPDLVEIPEAAATAPRDACAIRVLESDDRLAGISPQDFLFDGVQSQLVFAFISPHSDFRRVTSALQRLAGNIPVVAVSTAGELCSGTGGSLYK